MRKREERCTRCVIAVMQATKPVDGELPLKYQCEFPSCKPALSGWASCSPAALQPEALAPACSWRLAQHHTTNLSIPPPLLHQPCTSLLMRYIYTTCHMSIDVYVYDCFSWLVAHRQPCLALPALRLLIKHLYGMYVYDCFSWLVALHGPKSWMTSLWQLHTSRIASGVPIPAPRGSPAGPNQWFCGAPVVRARMPA